MEYIKVNCVTGNSYEAYKLSHQRDLPKNINLIHCGQELENGIIGKSFNVYKKFMKKGNKTYIIFCKY